MEAFTTGLLASIAADAIWGGIATFQGTSFEEHVRNAAEDTANEYENVQPEHFDMLFRTERVKVEIRRFKDAGRPPDQAVLSAELARITNLDDELDLDAVCETYWRHLERRLSTDEEVWRRIQTTYVQEQFDEMEAIRKAIDGLSEDLQQAVSEPSSNRGPILEIAHFEPVSAEWSSRMFDELGGGGMGAVDEMERQFFEEMMGLFGNSAVLQLAIRNVSSEPAISPGVRIRLGADGEEYERTFPIAVDDLYEGLPLVDDRGTGPTTIGGESTKEYLTYIIFKSEDFPRPWRDQLPHDGNGEIAPTTALRALHEAGISSMRVDLDLLYEDQYGTRDALSIVSRECPLGPTIDFRQLLVSAPGERDYLDAYLDLLEEEDVDWP